MKRHKSLIPLSHDHHHGLLLSQLIKKDAPQYKGLPTDLAGKIVYTFQFYNSELINHFKDEEEILFPNIKNVNEDINLLISELLEEHRYINSLIEKLEHEKDKEEILDKLGYLLESHIRKEERQLFPMVQENILPELLEKIGKEIESNRGSENEKKC